MGLIYLFIKIFPFFGLSLTVVGFDLARNFRRKGNRAWYGMIVFSLFFAAASVLWIVYRGDKNADYWFRRVTDWLHAK